MNLENGLEALGRSRMLCATWTTFPSESGLASLPQTAAGATSVANAIHESGVLADTPTIIIDPPGITFLNAIEDLVARTQESGDGVIVYLASHGLPPTSVQQLYRLATGETKQPDDLLRSIPIDEVIKKIKESRAPVNLLIVDACYSARAGESIIGSASKAIDASNLDNLCVLSSSGPYSPSNAPTGQELTDFTRLLVDVLRGGDPTLGRYLTIANIYASIRAASQKNGQPAPFLFAQGLTAETSLIPNAGQHAELVGSPFDPTVKDDNRAEILYVDDDAAMLDVFRNELQRVGHAVKTVATPDEARQCVETAYYDIIVVDLFLFGDLPASELITYLSQAAKESTIIVASRESKGRLEESWLTLSLIFQYTHRVAAFLFKNSFIGTVTEIANRVRARRKLVLDHIVGIDQWTPFVSGRLVRRGAIPESQSAAAEIQTRICVERLVSRWFHQGTDVTDYVHSMHMEPIDSGRSVCSVFTLTPTIHGLEPTNVNPLLLKVGPRNEIREEVDRYEKFVQLGVPLELRTDKISSAEVADVGAVLYSFLGEAAGSIIEVGELDPDGIMDCLSAVFDPARKRWYASVGVGDGVRLLDFFAERKYNVRRFAKLAHSMNESLKRMGTSIGEVHRDFAESPLMGLTRPTTLVHGDLHLGNILKYGDRRYALIDYRTVGIGPRLADFVTLEIACWLKAPAPEISRSELLSQAVDALSGQELSLSQQLDKVAPWLRDSFRLAVHCRHLAQTNFPDMTPTEYGCMLWLSAVRRSELTYATTAQEKRTLKVMLIALTLTAQDLVES